MWVEEARKGLCPGFKATRCAGATAAQLALASVSSGAQALGPAATAPDAAIRKDEDEGGACVMPCRAGLCKWAAGTPAARESVSSGQGQEWTGREEQGSRHLFRPPASAWAEKHVLPGAPARAPQPRRPHRLSCAPWGWGPAILLTSWGGAPSLGSNLSGALDHSGRRRLGSHSHTGRRGPGGHGRGSGSHGERAAGPPGSPPTPTPPLSLGKEGRRRGPRGAVTSEAVCTMAPLRAGHEMDSWFPSQLSKCHPAPKHTPPRAPPQWQGMGGTEEPRCHPQGFTGQSSRGPEGPQFPCLEGGHPAWGAGRSPPAQKTRGRRACRGAD